MGREQTRVRRSLFRLLAGGWGGPHGREHQQSRPAEAPKSPSHRSSCRSASRLRVILDRLGLALAPPPREERARHRHSDDRQGQTLLRRQAEKSFGPAVGAQRIEGHA